MTWFYERRELEEMLMRGGFTRCQILSVALRPFAQSVFTFMHEWPLKLYRRLRKRDDDGKRPQTYDGTWAFRNGEVLERTKPVLHLYWTIVGALLRMWGDPFEVTLTDENILGCQLVILAWR